MILENVKIGDGHTYTIEVNAAGKVIKTACLGRWPLTITATGDKWLDEQLQLAANRILENE